MSKHNAEEISKYEANDEEALPVIIELDYSSGSHQSDTEDVGEFDGVEDALPVNIELDFSFDS